MKKIKLFCDSSVNPQSKIGIAAFLYYEDDFKNESKIYTKQFEDTSSTKLELQTFLWAIKELDKFDKFEVYTDCQNIFSLLNRREKLESNNYKTSTNKEVKNQILYKEFYIVIDKNECNFIKVKGHKKSSEKDDIDKIFSKVDKASRQALRKHLNIASME